jgi:Lon protease-like protein
MSVSGPRLAELPIEFPIFPLPGALLLPRGKLPLNIFEPRYLALTEDALAAGRLFGMIQPDPARRSAETGPALFRVGCLGRLCSFSETEDGRYLITLTGVIRFRVVEELATRRGYRRIRADFSPYTADLEPGAPAIRGIERGRLLAALRSYFDRRGFEANWEAIEKMPDHGLVTTLCMVCTFDPCEKQALLEAPGPAERAAALLALLEIDSHTAIDESPGGRRAGRAS